MEPSIAQSLSVLGIVMGIIGFVLLLPRVKSWTDRKLKDAEYGATIPNYGKIKFLREYQDFLGIALIIAGFLFQIPIALQN